MASDRRLHPVSVLFTLASTARELLLPGIAVLFASQSGDWGWRVGTMGLFIPYAIVALTRALSFRYRLEDDELVIRSGVIFKSVRHIPYSRVHNVDAVQNVVHRLLGVAVVRIETGGGAEPEATLTVLSLDAFNELRQQIMERRRSLSPAAPAAEAATHQPEVVLRLSTRELALSGLIRNRGALLISAALGLVWEFGAGNAFIERISGESVPGGGLARQIVAALGGRAQVHVVYVLLALLGFVALLIALRVLSMIWTVVTLYGYTLTQQGDDLRSEFGLLTRVTATTPLKRIQTLTINEGPLHRAFERVSLRVQTAGDTAPERNGRPTREALAPLLSRQRVPELIRRVLPGIDVSAPVWRSPHPRAFRRAFARSATFAVLLSAWLIYPIGWRWLTFVPFLLAWAAFHARLYVRHLRWGTTSDAVLFESGWLWRQTTIVSLERIQAVAMNESPFDRRHGMASVLVDTFGAGGSPHIVDIPYIERPVAGELVKFLYGHAAATTFRT